MSTSEIGSRVQFYLAGLVLAGTAACSGAPPPVLTDIGNAIDRGTNKAVGKTGAVPPRSLPPAAEGEEEAVTKARDAYEEGKLAYETADYIKAVDKFVESFDAAGAIEDEQLKLQVQSSLYYNMGAAHLYAYDLDNDRTRLGQSKALLQKYLDAYPEISAEEREQIEELMAHADAKAAETSAG